MHRGTGTTTILGAILGAALLTPAAPAQVLPHQQRISLLNEALEAFDRGKSVLRSHPSESAEAFREAAAKFRAIIDSGVQNGRLYYNLGNAELELGNLGRAIVCYRRAQKLIPGDARLNKNLDFARSLRRNQIPAKGRSELLGTVFFLHYGTALRTRFIAALVCYAAFWAVLIARVFVRRFRLGTVAVVLALAWISLGASVAVSAVEDRHPAGVIVSNDVIVRKGNDAGYEPMFKQPLHEGVEFDVIESRGAWYRVELPDGTTGWIPSDQAELI